MRSALSGLAGVKVKSVSKGKASLITDGKVSEAQIIAAIKKVGFGASVNKS